ncbi:hypothetical protein [Streptacidiphilus carbonis]|jgi:hypothetical protein|uniref:hypothetical protein n=1 Tax=Streptacidiphilus carbonis TaxID=105422 RepID=UPI0005A93667|nr:hypothetical protein [Streptacidiphilus carbonis]
MRRKAQRDRAAAALGERLRTADRELSLPPGLWERVSAEPPVARIGAPAPRPRRPSRLVAGFAVLAVTVGLIALGAWWLARPGAPAPGSAVPGAGSGTPLTVFNAEAPCRSLRTMECGLRLARDPYARYADDDNAAGRVWNGDRVGAQCVVSDGTLVEDESGITSTRWYLVTTANGVRGWLPGVRTRNTVDIRDCTPAEAGIR